MNEEQFSLGFDFSESGLDKFLNEIIQLQQELKDLSSQMVNLPMEEVIKKQQQYRISLQGIYETVIKVNSANKESGQILSTLLEETDSIVSSTNKLISAQQSASKTVVDFQRELKAQESIIRSTTKSLEEWTVGAYKGKESIEKLQGILIAAKTRYSELSEVIKIHNTEIEEQIGYYENLRSVLKELEAERDLIIAQNGKEAEGVEELTALIQKYNLELGNNKRELAGINEAEALLQKNLEAVVKITNQDADAIARVIIEKEKLNKAVQQEIVNLGYVTEAQIKQMEVAEKSEISQVESAVKVANTREELQIKTMLRLQALRLKEIESEISNQERLERKILELQLKKIELAQTVALKNEEAANKSIVSWDNFTNIFERMGLRMIASLVWWTLIIGAATTLLEIWRRIDEESQNAIDRVKDYFSNFKSHEKNEYNSIPRTFAKIEFDSQEVDRQQKIMNDQNRYLDERFNAYKKIYSIAPLILDQMDKETFKAKMNSEAMQEQNKHLSEYIELTNKRSKEQRLSLDTKETFQQNSQLRTELRNQIIPKLRESDLSGKFTDDELLKRHLSGVTPNGYLFNKQNHEYDVTHASIGDKLSAYKQVDIDMSNLLKQDIEHEKNLDDLEKAISSLEGKTKDRKSGKSGPNQLHEIIRNRESSYSDQSKKNTEDYQSNEPANTFESDLGYHEKQLSEGIKHYDALLDYVKKHRSLDKADDEEYTRHVTDLSAKRTEVINREQKAINDIRAEEKRRFDESLKQMDDWQRKVDDINNQLSRQLSKYGKDRIQGQANIKSAKRVNPLFAAFGVEDTYSSFLDSQDKLQNSADDHQRDINDDKKRRSQLVIERTNYSDNLSKAGIEFKNNKPTDEQGAAKILSQDKTGFLQKQFDEYKRVSTDISSYDTKLVQDSDSKQNDLDKKQADQEKLRSDAKKETIRQTFEYTQKIANQEFDLQKKRIQNELTAVQAKYQYEMLLAGNNSAARIKLAQREHEESLALRRKEAALEKAQAEFNAIINIASGEVAALKYGPAGIPLMAIIASLGLAELAVISATPLPQYKFGRRGGKKELARINEENTTELVQDKTGRYKVFGGGKDTIAQLEDGDTVHTHEDSLKISEKTGFFKSLLKATGIIDRREDIKKHERMISFERGINKEEMEDVMTKFVKQIPVPVLQMPAKGVEDRLLAQHIRNGLG